MVTRAIAAALLLFLTQGSASATMWRVEKDGSGHFLQIQDAVEAAASGDTIAIGPGLWMKFQEFQAPGGTFESIAYPQQESITFRGSGVDTTTLAYAFGPAGPDHPNGIVGGATTSMHVEALSILDLRHGVEANGPSLTVKNVKFQRNVRGIASWSWMGTLVDACEFVDGSSGIVVFRGLGAKNVEIVNSSFSGDIKGVDLQSDLPGRIENCTFRETRIGVQTSLGGSSTVTDCTFLDTSHEGVRVGSGSSCDLRDSTFDATSTGYNVSVAGSGTLVGSGNVLRGAGISTIDVISGARVEFHRNDIRYSGLTAVSIRGSIPDPPMIDLTNNYWGTTDPAQIAEWIHDANDDPQVTGVVLFEPFAEQSVPTAKSSFGRIKSRY